MTSSQAEANYYFLSRREPEVGDVEKLLPVSCGQCCRESCESGQSNFEWRESRCRRRVRSNGQKLRGWSEIGGLWWQVLSVMLAAMVCQSAETAASRDDRLSVKQLGRCRAAVTGSQSLHVLDLSQLSTTTGSARYTASVGNGWQVAWSPCVSFDLPPDPHSGSEDQCFHVAMCMYKQHENNDNSSSSSSASGDYYTMGIHRTAQFIAVPPFGTRGHPRSTLLTSQQPVNSTPSHNPPDVNTRSGEKNWSRIENERRTLAIVNYQQSVRPTTKAIYNVSSGTLGIYSHTLIQRVTTTASSNVTTTTAEHDYTTTTSNANTTRNTTTEASAEDGGERKGNEKEEERDDLEDKASEVDSSDYDDDDDDRHNREQQIHGKMKSSTSDDRRGRYVAALLYHGIRSKRHQKSIVYIVCHRRIPASPQFVYLGSTQFQHYYKLRYCCCCVDGRCKTADDSDSEDRDDEKDDVDGVEEEKKEEEEEKEEEDDDDDYEDDDYDDDDDDKSKVNDTLSSRDADEDRESEGEASVRDGARRVQRSARHIWLLIVVNVAIVVTALLMAAFCCRRAHAGGTGTVTSGPYSYLPGVHGSDENLYRPARTGAVTPETPTGLWPSIGTSLTSSKSPKSSARSAVVSSRQRHRLRRNDSAGVPLLDYCIIPTDQVDISQRLGGEYFIDTYAAQWRGRRVAAKRITVGTHQRQIKGSPYCDWIVSNILTLSKQRHESLANVIGLCIDTRQPYVIVEFVEGESLRDLIRRTNNADQRSSWNQRIKVCYQTADGLAFLHSCKPPILHRDLRSANILMDSRGHVKLSNFGFTKIIQRFRNDCGRASCYCRKETSAVPDTLRWTAPEILAFPNSDETTRPDVFTTSCDVYSFAMLLWELATFTDPFEDVTDESEVMKTVLDGGRPSLQMIPYDTPGQYVELMTACWEEVPRSRPNFKQISQYMRNMKPRHHHGTSSKPPSSAGSSQQQLERIESRSSTTGYLRSVLNVSANTTPRDRSDSASSAFTSYSTSKSVE